MVNNMLYDIKKIQEILPHRYPFLLIDQVISINEEQTQIHARKCVTINEPFFQGHFPNEPIMPGVLQLEAIAQAGAVVILSKDEFKGKLAIFAGASNVKWKRIVRPGDVLDINVELLKMRGSFGFAKGIITVDGEVACQAEIAFVIQ